MSEKYPICHVGRLRIGTDGEGIRTLIVVQGCPLRCKYCINSFTWDGTGETELLSAKELYEQIVIDRPYMIATRGGITFGGGEPLLYPKLILDMKQMCESEMSLYVETSLYVPWENVSCSSNAIDKYYIDIKSMNEEIYEKYTRGSLAVALENLKRLVTIKGPDSIVVRIPIISGFSHAKEQEEAKMLLRQLGVTNFDLFTYKQ